MVTGKANKWTPIKKFSGTFDGQNHTINGLYIDSGAGVKDYSAKRRMLLFEM